MAAVTIEKQSELANGWEFQVAVGQSPDQTHHTVRLDRPYWEKIAGTTAPREFVIQTFEFLLSRESRESILQQFNVRQVSTYFPEFEETIGQHGQVGKRP